MRETKREIKVIVRYININVLLFPCDSIVINYRNNDINEHRYAILAILLLLILQYTALVALGTQLVRDLATIGLVTICKCQEVPISATHNTIGGIYIPIPRAILGSEPNRRPSRAHNMDMTNCQVCTSSDLSVIFS